MCRVLEADPDLAEAVPPQERPGAIARCVAATLRLRAGSWPKAGAPGVGGGIGLLVLDGLLIRRVGIDGRFGAELLGRGDLLRPWQGEDEPPTLAIKTSWRVLEPTFLAVLDERFAAETSRYPQLTGRFVSRALERSRQLAVNMAIVHHPRVDVRLHMLMWHLASRWGIVGQDGVSLRIRLTHSVLADLAAARRPTVTSALAELSRSGLIESIPEGWLLPGQPPGELLQLGAHAAAVSRSEPAGRRA